MVAEVGEVSVKVYGDLTRLQLDLAQAEAMTRKFDAAMNRAVGNVKGGKQFVEALARGGDEVQALARKFNPLHAKLGEHLADLNKISDLYKSGVLSKGMAEAYTKSAQAAFQQITDGQSKLYQLGQKAGNFIKTWGVEMAAAALTATVMVVRGALKRGEAIYHESKLLGMSIQEYQRWQYVAEQSGVTAGKFSVAMQNLQRSMGRASVNPKSKDLALFRALDIKLIDQATGKAKNQGQVLQELAGKMALVRDENQRMAAAQLLFGMSANEMMAMLEGGGQKLDELAAAYDRLGIALSDEQVKKLHDANQKFEAMGNVLSSKMAQFVADNADSLIGLADTLMDAGDAALKFGKAYGDLQTIKIIGLELPFLKMLNPLSQAIEAVRTLTGLLNGLAGLNVSPTVNVVIRQTGSLMGIPGIGTMFGGALAGYNMGQSIGQSNRPKTWWGGPVAQKADLSWMKNWGLGSQAAPSGKGIDLSKVFGGSGGGGRRRRGGGGAAKENFAGERAFNNEMAQLERQLLMLARDEVGNANEKAAIDLQLLKIDRDRFDENLRISVASKRYTAEEAKRLAAERDLVDKAEREKIERERQETILREATDLSLAKLQADQESLQVAQSMALTDEERRQIELDLLNIETEIKRAKLAEILASKQSSDAQKEIARLELERLAIVSGQKAQAIRMQDVHERTVNFAEGFADAFANATESLLALNDPLEVLHSLLLDLTRTFNEELIVRPIREFAREKGLSIGKKLTGYNTLAAETSLGSLSSVTTQTAANMALLDAAMQRFLATLQFAPTTGGGGLGGAGGFLSMISGLSSTFSPSPELGLSVLQTISDPANAAIFHDGGEVGPGGIPIRRGAGEVGITAKVGEYIIPEGPARKFRPWLDAMRTGEMPSMAGLSAARGGSSTSLSVSIGDIIVPGAQSERAGRATAKQVASEIQSTIAKAARQGMRRA